MRHDYIAEPQRHDVVTWLYGQGFIREDDVLAICWSTRIGIDSLTLGFYPLARHANDTGWDVIVGHHASGTNPRMAIGICENLADVQRTYEALRLINGYIEPDPHRQPTQAKQEK